MGSRHFPVIFCSHRSLPSLTVSRTQQWCNFEVILDRTVYKHCNKTSKFFTVINKSRNSYWKTYQRIYRKGKAIEQGCTEAHGSDKRQHTSHSPRAIELSSTTWHQFSAFNSTASTYKILHRGCYMSGS